MRHRARAILTVMMKRAAALLMALVVAAAPSALACQISCASTSMRAHGVQASDAYPMHHGGGQARPSCHESAKPAHAVSPASLPCDHNDALMSSSLVTTRPDVMASAAVHVVAADVANTAPAVFAHRGQIVLAINRLELRLFSPLRI